MTLIEQTLGFVGTTIGSIQKAQETRDILKCTGLPYSVDLPQATQSLREAMIKQKGHFYEPLLLAVRVILCPDRLKRNTFLKANVQCVKYDRTSGGLSLGTDFVPC